MSAVGNNNSSVTPLFTGLTHEQCLVYATIEYSGVDPKAANLFTFTETGDIKRLTGSENLVKASVGGAGTDDQQISVQGSNLVLEDGGQVEGKVCTDLAGNDIALVIEP